MNNYAAALGAIVLVATTLGASHLVERDSRAEEALKEGIRGQQLEEKVIGLTSDYFGKIYAMVDNFNNDLLNYKYYNNKRVEALEARIKRLEEIVKEDHKGGLTINNQNTISDSNK